MNGIPSLASLLQVYTQLGHGHMKQVTSLIVARGLSLISIPRLQQAWEREQACVHQVQ